ncbi:MAG: arginine deiminase-related protein [Bacteroidota bacterium]
MINISVKNETSKLRAVVLGTAERLGGVPALNEAYDPKSKEHIKNGTYPMEGDLIEEMEGFAKVLKKYEVEVFRPKVLEDYNQVYSRDIGFVIDHIFIIPHILSNRAREIEGIRFLIDQMPSNQVIEVPEGARVEGGDVMPWNDHLFIGYSEAEDFNKYVVSRTNRVAVDFLTSCFPNRTVKAFELNKSDDDPKENALHLDCCFQPVGEDMAIIYEGGFKNPEDYEFLVGYFGKEKLIPITKEEMYDMNSNVFSISTKVVVSDIRFERLNGILKDHGFTVEPIRYAETAKMEGLLRCSTLPLIRD